MMAICDAFCRFTWIDVGDMGPISDRLAFANTDLNEDLEREEADLPPPCNLPRSGIKMPHFFIGDKIIPLKKFLMTPFARRYAFAKGQQNYNRRHIIEADFGILAATWQILK